MRIIEPLLQRLPISLQKSSHHYISAPLSLFQPRHSKSGGCRTFSTSPIHATDFTHAVVGGGVVGLAIARQLQKRGGDTVLLERHGMLGSETSSRNSEVIHAGLYYGPSSLKTQLCLRGKELLYSLCSAHSIPHRQTGKWIVAQNASQLSELHKIHSLANDLGVPTRFLTKEEAKEREPHVRAEAGVLESSSTGIVDSHALMQFLEADFEKEGGTVACKSEVVGIQAIDEGRGGWEITIRSPSPTSTSSSTSEESSNEESEAETSTLTVSTLINSAGLSAIPISNMILPPSRHLVPYYAKGTYFSYSKSTPKTSTLIYPAPSPGHAGLGTHLTLDLSGRIRFGPDVSWTDSPTDYVPNTANLAAAIEEIRTYLPSVDVDEIQPDYVGIRPKLGKGAAGVSGKTFQDFWIRKEEGFEGFVNLLGIESPGLTSALGIAERVEGELY